MKDRCPQSGLVEALHDGRVGDRERISVERHVRGCADCAELLRELKAIGDAIRVPIPDVTELEHQRGKQRLLSRFADASMSSRESSALGRYRTVLWVAAALFLVGFGFALARWTASGESAWNSASSASGGKGLRKADVSGSIDASLISYQKGTTIHASEGAEYQHASVDRVESVHLHKGTLMVQVGSLPADERFMLSTKDADLEGKKTRFEVEAVDGQIRRVVVKEGSVDVRYAGYSLLIPAGGSWQARDTVASVPSSSLVASNSGASNSGASNSGASNSGTSSSGASNPTAAKIASIPPVQVPASTPIGVADVRAPQVKPSEPEPASVNEPSLAFNRAMEALGSGRTSEAASRFWAFSAAYPTDARADEADYLRAIALQRAGQREEARSAARGYLDQRPQGAHRADAEVIAK